MYIADHSDSIVFRPITIAIPLDSDKCRFLFLILIRIRLHLLLSQKAPPVVPSLRCVQSTPYGVWICFGREPRSFTAIPPIDRNNKV